LKDVAIADTNDNNVTDYVESNRATLELNNTFSDTIIEPNTSIRIDTSLEDATNRINDDQSQVQISVTRIEDLDEGKTYNNTDSNWSSIVSQYVTLS
jgi:thymidylate kinase